MEKPNRGGNRERLRTLGRLRLTLCVIALLLCGSIGVSAVTLTPWIKPEGEPESGLPTAATVTVTETAPETTVLPLQQENPSEVPEPGNPGANIPDNDSEQSDADSGAQRNTVQNVTISIPIAPETEAVADEGFDSQPEPQSPPAWALPVLVISAVLLAADLVGIAVCSAAIRRLQSQLRQRPETTGQKVENVDTVTHTLSRATGRAGASVAVGQLHNIGARPSQQDSSGVVNLSDGVLAVVADGMGGLSDGDKVSQKIVYTMLEYSRALRSGQMDGALERMLDGVNAVINQTFGQGGSNKCGSTLLAVLVRQNRFHWIAVGDSHIYLYHEGSLVQLNQEHNRGQELLRQAIAGQLTFDEVRADPKKSGLTSFLGMGRLRYVEKSLYSIPLVPGDRIVLMTDGVFNALSDETICSVLSKTPDVAEAARVLEQGVLARAASRQDNFTAVILGI